MADDQNGFADDIIPDHLPTHVEPRSAKFLPWHKVRKEFIRTNQWNELTLRLAENEWNTELRHNPLSCLVIPGDDLLDVRALWRDLRKKSCRIRYLGFNESAGSDQEGTRVHIANNDVTGLIDVERDSRVIPDRFQSIAKSQSQACRYLKEFGPYHVVNLDLCGTLFPSTSGTYQPYLEAIHALLQYQFEKQRSDWLMFITTEVEPSAADLAGLETLCTATANNLTTDELFAEELAKLIPKEAFESSDHIVEIGLLSEEEILSLFGVAFGKWLLALCESGDPKWTIGMRRSFRYPINADKGVVMLSLAFHLSPRIVPPSDSIGVSKLNVKQPTPVSESELAVKLARSVGAIRDVDVELTSDRSLWAALRDSSADLLAAAGYDRSGYIEWVDGGELPM